MDVAVEHERKLDAPEGFRLPELGGTPLEARLFTSVYHDVPGGSLAAAGITLRRRLERGRSVWQLKLLSSDARLELEAPGGPGEPPEELRRLLVAHLRHGPPRPVAELRTRRRGELVVRGDATAEVTLDEVAVMDARRVESEFVEVEVELRSGDPRRLDDVVDELLRAGARRGDGLPKVFRALALDAGPRARPREPFDALRDLLHRQLRELLAHDPGTRLGADPESLHDMRVAARRSRALLRAGRRLLAEAPVDLADELKWLGTALGRVRDVDVLLARLIAQAERLDTADRAAARRLLRVLGRERTAARRALMRALESERYFALLDGFEREIDGLQPADGAVSLASLARRELKKVRSTAVALPDEPADAELHELRKRGKRARYAAELAGQHEVVRRAKRLQDVLGEHQDAVVAEERLRRLVEGRSIEEALAAGRLVEGERRRRAEARAAWPRALKRLERAAR